MRGVFLLLVLGNLSLSAKPIFKLEERPFFSFPVVGDSKQSLTLLLYTVKGSQTQVRVSVIEVRDPGGVSCNLNPANPALKLANAEPLKVTENGSPITFKANLSEFVVPGDYRVSILLSAPGGGSSSPDPFAEKLHFMIRRLPAELDTAHLSGREVHLTKALPFGFGETKKRSFTLAIRETSGVSDANLSISLYPLYRQATKELAQGDVANSSESVDLKAGGVRRAKLEVSGLNQTGTFVSDILISSHSLARPVSVPVIFKVSDSWFWAWLTIIFGVIGGFCCHRIANKSRPSQVNSLAIRRLSEEVADLETRTSLATTKAKLTDLRRRISNAREKNELDDFPGASALIVAITAALDEIRKSEATKREDVEGSLAQLRSDFESYSNALGGERAAHLETLDSIRSEIALGKGWLNANHPDNAAGHLDSARREFGDLRRGMVRNTLETLLGRIRGIEGEDGFKREIEKTIQGLSDDSKLDELTEMTVRLEKEINEALRKSQTAEIATASVSSLSRAARSEPVPTIAIKPEPDHRKVNTEIEFELLHPPADRPSGSAYKWEFGDTSGMRHDMTKGPARHTYKLDGIYHVSVSEISPDGKETDLRVSRSLTVLRGAETDRILDTIKHLDWVLALIAALLASITGLLYLYFEAETFGTVPQYLGALLWGFGIDTSVRRFFAVYGKISSPAT